METKFPNINDLVAQLTMGQDKIKTLIESTAKLNESIAEKSEALKLEKAELTKATYAINGALHAYFQVIHQHAALMSMEVNYAMSPKTVNSVPYPPGPFPSGPFQAGAFSHYTPQHAAQQDESIKFCQEHIPGAWFKYKEKENDGSNNPGTA